MADYKRIEDKIDKLDSRVDNIDVSLAKISITLDKNTDSLNEHIKRTNLLEEYIKAIDKHIHGVRIAAWMLGGISTVIFYLYQAGILQKIAHLLFQQ